MVIRPKLDETRGRAEFQPADAKRLGTLPQPMDDEQCFRLRRQRAKAVDDLGLEIVHAFPIQGARESLVELKSQVDVRHVVFRQERGQLQVDLAARGDWLIEVWLAPLAQGDYCALQQFEIETNADLLDLAALILAEEFAGATDFKVLGRKREAGSEVLERFDRLETLAGIVGQRGNGRGEQIGPGAVMRTADPAAQLV